MCVLSHQQAFQQDGFSLLILSKRRLGTQHGTAHKILCMEMALMSKGKSISVRLSEDEDAHVRQQAAIANITMSEFIISACMNKTVIVLAESIQIASKLHHIMLGIDKVNTLMENEGILEEKLKDDLENLCEGVNQLWESLNLLEEKM